MTESAVFVGIDVSKAQLDVAVRPSGSEWSVPYTERLASRRSLSS
jgi:hypothetical protein